MKKKTIVIIAIVMAVIILALYIAVSCIYSLFENENKIYILGLVVLTLLPFILLLAMLPTPQYKLRSPSENDDSNSKETDTNQQ